MFNFDFTESYALIHLFIRLLLNSDFTESYAF